MTGEDIQIMARHAARSGFRASMLAYTSADLRDYYGTVLPAAKAAACKAQPSPCRPGFMTRRQAI